MLINKYFVNYTIRPFGQRSPAGRHFINILTMELFRYGHKKRRGSKFLTAPIPKIRPSHCPLVRISNVKPAHVISDNICTLRSTHP